MRRIPERCYFCGDPALSEWYCLAHLWAEGNPVSPVKENSLSKLTKDHAFWIERLTPDQILDLAGYLEAA